MKRLLTLVAFFATLHASAQQVNPVPDYVFRNQMSVGRGTVTDTAAYFSIGPRYGATKGFMPPIVGDTATFSSGKRNGLLIFSVQKNKFLYWDSVRVQWSDMAGSSGAYIVAGDTSAMLAPYLRKADTTSMLTAYLRKADTTAMLSPYYRSATASAALALKLNISDTSSMLANYIRHAGYGLTKSGQSFLVDTLNIATRAWRQKGLDSLAALEVSGSGTTNYVPKFTASATIGNSVIQENSGSIGINGAVSPIAGDRLLQINGTTYSTINLKSTDVTTIMRAHNPLGMFYIGNTTNHGIGIITNDAERVRVFANGRVFVGASPTDAGYQLDINGTLRSVNGANFATTSGNVGIGTASPASKLDVLDGDISVNTLNTFSFFNTNRNTIPSGAGTSLGGLRYRAYSTGTTYQVGAQILSFSSAAWSSTSSPSYLSFQTTPSGSVTPSERMVIDASGNVGIGVVPSSWDATLKALQVGNSLSLLGQGGAAEIGFNEFYDGTNYKYIQSSQSASLYGLNQGQHRWYIAPSGTAGANITWTQAMTLNASGNLGIGTASPASILNVRASSATLTIDDSGDGTSKISFRPSAASYAERAFLSVNYGTAEMRIAAGASGGAYFQSFYTNGTERGRINSAGEWILDASGTDAGDYKLQVVGNARIGTGKLDIASNTTFGLGVARSGTSEVAGQIYNSNGILYLGAESSAGGQIFSGSSAYAGVIGTGANYPLQFAVNNITRGGFSTSGNLLLGFTTDSYFLKLQVNGSIFSNNQFFGQGANAQLSIDSSTNISPLYVSAHSLTGTSAQAMLYSNTTWNTTGNPSLLDLNVTNTASGATSNYIKITDGTNTFRVTKAAEVVTAAPSGGSIKPWKLGEAATVSPTSPNRTIRVEIDGTVYYLHAKTTND